MKIEWTVTYTALFDIDQAEKEYYDYMNIRDNPTDENEAWDAICEAISNNINADIDIDDIPDEIRDKCVKALKDRIGGIQMSMFD